MYVKDHTECQRIFHNLSHHEYWLASHSTCKFDLSFLLSLTAPRRQGSKDWGLSRPQAPWTRKSIFTHIIISWPVNHLFKQSKLLEELIISLNRIRLECLVISKIRRIIILTARKSIKTKQYPTSLYGYWEQCRRTNKQKTLVSWHLKVTRSFLSEGRWVDTILISWRVESEEAASLLGAGDVWEQKVARSQTAATDWSLLPPTSAQQFFREAQFNSGLTWNPEQSLESREREREIRIDDV